MDKECPLSTLEGHVHLGSVGACYVESLEEQNPVILQRQIYAVFACP